MDRMDWNDIRLFLALAREGSLSGAARTLGIGVATISRRIERMEQVLGLPLFLRHQQGYDLTDQGAALLPRAEAVELAALTLRQEAGSQTDIRGLVRVASVESLIAPFLVPALKPLLAGNPKLDVEILYSTATVNLHRHDADLALRLVRPEAGNLTVRRLATMRFGLYGPPDGARPARHVTWPEAAGLGVPLPWSNAFGAQQGARLAVNNLHAQVAAVRDGLGMAVLPHFLARAAGLGLLEATLPDGTAMERPLLLVTHADLAGSRRVRAVADAIAATITGRRVELEQA